MTPRELILHAVEIALRTETKSAVELRQHLLSNMGEENYAALMNMSLAGAAQAMTIGDVLTLGDAIDA